MPTSSRASCPRVASGHPTGGAPNDEALKLLDGITGSKFDVGAALKKDKHLELAHLYYVGFHFSESQHPLGVELLEHVAKEGGRSKLGKMAKNKLGLSG